MCLFSIGVLESLGKVVWGRGKIGLFVGCTFSDQGELVEWILGGQLKWVVELCGRQG